MRQYLLALGVSMCLPFCAVQTLEAGIIASDGTHTGNRSDFAGTVGTRFTVGSTDIVVTALGYEDPGANGLTASHAVGLWTDSGTLLGSVTVLAGSSGTAGDQWSYVSLATPVLLTAGTTYRIGAQVFFGVDAWTDTQGAPPEDFSYGPLIVDAGTLTNVFVAGGFAFPATDGTGDELRWAPANALAVAVPEPSSMVLIGLGGIALAAYQRRRRKSKV